MTTLSELITVVRIEQNRGELHRDFCSDEERALIDYLVSHAADIAERERLERAVIEAWPHLEAHDARAGEYKYAVHNLAQWVIAHAASDDPAARS